MSVKDAIEYMGCEKKRCSFLDREGIYTFCKALGTNNMCLIRNRMNKEDMKKFYKLAKKYGFYSLFCKCVKCSCDK